MLLKGENNSILKSTPKPGLFRLAWTREGIEGENGIYEIVDLSGSCEVKYFRGRYLGKGGYAKCYEVTQDISNKVLACKIVRKNLHLREPYQENREVMIHQSVKHPYVVDFHSYFEDDRFMYIILELCEKQSLLQLSNKRGAVTEPEARYFLRQICEGVMYLHEDENVIHQDLKLGNIFITSGMNLKIGDFGLAMELDRFECKQVGTPNYIAPEVVKRTGHGIKADMWSIGCILYTLLIGKPPFETGSLKQTLTKIKACDFEIPKGSNLSPEATRLILQLIQLDPSKRPTAREILMDDFITQGFIPDSLPALSLTEAPPFPSAEDQARLVLARKCAYTVSRLPKLYTTWFQTSRSVLLAFPNGTFQTINFSTQRKILLRPAMDAVAVSVLDSGQPKRSYKLDYTSITRKCAHVITIDLEYSVNNAEIVKPDRKLVKQLLSMKAEMNSLEKKILFKLLWLGTFC
ncbi:Serine/threonine-protein kinase PLK1 [Orchesella cincta]|uniref:Serine/threonine-protein kinase PLK1 n=1 Tax=Orchesella cincta TaxID=48709 RepID=A0A1D2NH13_ORCCI|nr:Serine/threonine-protein kinase PLK1 [Orchesella cincta]